MATKPLPPTLVILAAGLGRRYGGLKQVESVGPAGEAILDYSVFDALRAGFGKAVFVIRPEMEADFRAGPGQRIEQHLGVAYGHQSVLTALPAGFTPPPDRTKPWGTGHAVLSAKDVVSGPFAVVNADDFYGASAFADLGTFLRQQPAAAVPIFAMVGYRLSDTLADSGAVSRAVCRSSPDGWLEGIEEIRGIERQGRDAAYPDSGGQSGPLSGDELVSMNCWAFTPAVFDLLVAELARFLAAHGSSPDAEFQLPTAMGSLIQTGAARVRILPSNETWCGVTHRQDRTRVTERIRELIAQRVYPPDLWARP